MGKKTGFCVFEIQIIKVQNYSYNLKLFTFEVCFFQFNFMNLNSKDFILDTKHFFAIITTLLDVVSICNRF